MSGRSLTFDLKPLAGSWAVQAGGLGHTGKEQQTGQYTGRKRRKRFAKRDEKIAHRKYPSSGVIF